jgi:hypothetical protein
MPNRPPKEWWNKMVKEVKSGNPDYSKDQVDKTVGAIWYKKMSPSKKKTETKKVEGLKKQAAQPLTLDQKYPLKLDRDVRNILFSYHQGEGDPLYGLLDRLTYDEQTRATDRELKALLEELNNAISDFHEEMKESDDENALQDVSKLEDAKEKVLHILRTKRANKKTAAEMRNLFAKDYESWIQMEARLLAQNNFGEWASLEEANQKIDEAIKELTQTLTKGIEPEVKRIVEEERKNILEEMEASITMGQEPGAPAPEPTLDETGAPPVGGEDLGSLETKVDDLMAPPGASKKNPRKLDGAPLHHDYKKAQIASGIEDRRTEEQKKQEHDKWEKAKKGPQQKLEDLSDEDLDAFEKSVDEKLAALDAKTAKGLTTQDMTRVKKDKDTKKKETEKKETKKLNDMFHSAQKTRDDHLDELYNEFLRDPKTDKVDFEQDQDVTDEELDKLWKELGMEDDEGIEEEAEEEYDRFAGKK